MNNNLLVYCPECGEFVDIYALDDLPAEDSMEVVCPHCNYIIDILADYKEKEYKVLW